MQRIRLFPHGILPLSIVIAASIACSSTPPPPAHATVTNTNASATSVATSIATTAILAPKTLCQQLAEEQNKALDAWSDEHILADALGASADVTQIHDLFTQCTQHANGSSAPVIDPPAAKGSKQDGFSWRIVYLHQDGSRSAQPNGVFLGFCFDIRLGFARSMRINNGDDLLATQFNVSCPDSESYDRNQLYRIRSGKLESLPELAKARFTLEDIDGDKLLDVMRTDALNVAYPACQSIDDWTDYTFPLVMHTLPDGTLTMVDATAKDDVKKRCPQKPQSIIPADRSPEQALDNLVCARFYGATTDALRADVDGFCKGIDTKCKCTGYHCCEEEMACRDALCSSTSAARELIAKPVPFTLN